MFGHMNITMTELQTTPLELIWEDWEWFKEAMKKKNTTKSR